MSGTPEQKISSANAFLTGENIYLRPLQESDAESDYPGWLNDAEVCAGNSHHVFPNTRKATLEYIDSVSGSKTCIVLAIVEKNTNVHVGNVSLQNINLISRSAEFAILLGNRSVWGKGYGAEALRLLIQHGFSELNLYRIYCGTFENNYGMQKLAGKLGMTQVGRLRKAVYKNGKYMDVFLYDLLQSEFIF